MEHLLLLSCFFVSIHGVSSLNSDGSALLSLLRHWNSVPPSITSSWNSSDSTPCSWLGITCDNSSFPPNVVSLELPGFAISGQLGSEISQLTHLQILDLSNNSLSGQIPEKLGTSCRLLQSLDLSLNAFTGQIPDSFKFFQSLSILSLYSNALSGKIPESLFGISSLEYVYLNSNNFSGSISDNVGNLSQVLELWMYGNRLSGRIPDSVGRCTKLQTLYLNENLLEGSLPNSLTNLKNLVYLYLHHNNFHGRIPSGFGNCKNLSVLDMSFNGFSGGIPADLGNSSSLTKLVIVDSNLGGTIPSSLGLLNQLLYLDLSENRLSGRIPPQLGKCRSLTSLKLYNNQLEGEIPDELGMLTKLQDLELFTNGLSGEIPISIWRIPTLEHLLVYNNSLSGELPQEMTELKQLKNISLFENRFSGVIPRGLGINSSLWQLDVTDNKFTGEIPPNLCSGKQLRVLNMGQNRLEGRIPSDVGLCPALWRLILKENNLTGPLPEFAETPSLEHIDISKNTISGSIPPSLGNSTSVTYFDFSMNSFSGLIPAELGNLVKLEYIDLSHNHLKGPLPFQLSNCFKLGFFDVGFNSLNGSIPSSLKNWTKLYTLSVRENQFTGGIPSFFSEFEMLTELQIGGNLLGGEIPSSIGSLRGLQYALNLSSNQLIGAIPSSLGDLIKLERLDISNNNLTGSLTALNRIQTLILINVSQNHFTGPIPVVMMNLLQSSPSSFFGNPGLCVDCSFKCTQNGRFKSCASQFRPRKSLGRVEIVMIALVSVAVVFILVFACVFTFHRRRKKDIEIAAAEEGPASLLGKVMEATENLSDRYIIGRGSHGTVYKASLGDDELYALKRIAFSDHGGGNKSMIREVQTIGKIRHRNLIRLEQFWLRKDYGLILYSYMENGSLHDVLHGAKAPSANLEWSIRYRIAIGTANALAYLHYDCDPPVVHRDIKPENILLDPDMEPHISDFGIAKLLEGHQSSASENSTFVMGTIGYMAPENAYTRMRSKESDVYSYGVVLLELITRKRALDPSFPDGTDIVGWCTSMWRNTQDINDIVDPGLAEEFYDSNTVDHVCNVFFLALRCTNSEPMRRPTMRDVVKQLVRENVATRKPLRVCSTG